MLIRKKLNQREDWHDFFPVDREKENKEIDQLRMELQEANKSNAAKSRFLKTLSHDMRTPMNAIMGLTDLAIQQKEDSEKVQECLHKIARSSMHLLELINNVLDLSRIESGKMSLQLQPFCMQTLMQDVVNMIQPQADRKMQTLLTEWNFCHEYVIGDTVRIRQILVNILSNAVKYTQQGGRLFFQISELYHYKEEDKLFAGYQIKIHDNGYGMSETFQQIIFEPFSKEFNENVEGIEGTGLGMTITKHLVELMGGKLSVESRLGEGTVFSVILPLQLEEAMEKEDSGMTGNPDYSCQGKKLLLVEDNELTSEVMKDILELEGAHVICAYNGNEAVEIFRQKGSEFAAVFMDVQMPVMDGYQATREIRAMSGAGESVPIVALTGNAFTEDILASREAGMNYHLSKPIKKKELDTVLRDLLSD